MKQGTRLNIRMVIIGAQGTGKTTFAKKAADKYGKKVLVIVPDDYERAWHPYPIIQLKDVSRMTTGKRRVIYDPDDKEFMLNLRNQFSNGLIIWDDSKTYFNTHQRVFELEKMMIRSRQTNVDHFFMYHGFSAIPGLLWTYTTDIALFNTHDSHQRSKDKILNYEVMEKRMAEVRAGAAKDPHFVKVYRIQGP